MRHWLGLIELIVALLFAGGWALLEWVASRVPHTGEQAAPSEGDARHPERQ
jgi:hypothetical protein